MLVITRADAVPKKRGPKTDVLEALLKRVDGLEAKLKEKKDQPAASTADSTTVMPTSATAAAAGASSPTTASTQDPSTSQKSVSGDGGDVKLQPVPPAIDTTRSIEAIESAVYTPSPSRCAYPSICCEAGQRVPNKNVTDSSASHSVPSPSIVQTDTLLDTYFARFHAKPFYILDESTVRQRLQLNQLPNYLTNAIYAVAARCVTCTLASATKLTKSLGIHRIRMDTRLL